MKKWIIGTVSVLLVAVAAALVAGYYALRAEGFFREPVFETVAPDIPQLPRPAILVFSKTNAFIHRDAIPAAKDMMKVLGEKNGWSVYFTDNGAVHNPEDLARFDAIVWNNVTGDVLTPEQRQAFKDYLKAGGGWVGIHGAGDSSQNWRWYQQQLVAAEFIGHPIGPGGPQFQSAIVRIETPDDPIVSHLPSEWERVDEWYSFAESPRVRGVKVLATLDPSSYSPKAFGRDISMGDDHPIIWKHCLGEGRTFYSALGHTAESYTEPEHVTLLERATAWAAGLEGAPCETPASAKRAANEDKRPNVLFILTDDQRWDAISLSGVTPPHTPHTDRLGEEGVYFPNAFATTSLCSPSRATILSGLYAHAHGVTDNFTEIEPRTPTWPQHLQKSGYKTAYIGKYHMGEDNDDVRPGFDYFVTHKGQGKYFDTEFRFHGGERRVVEGYYTHVVTDMAVEWLENQDGDQPWALMIGHKAPHSFYYPEPKYEDAYSDISIPYPDSAFQLDDKPDWYQQRLDTWHGIYGPLFDYRENWPDRSPEGVAAFEEMVRAYWQTLLSVDDSVGKLYEFLKERGELDNTLIIFTSDHGILNGEHGMIDKRTAHEPSIRIPLVVRYPGLTPPEQPQRVEQMVLTTDFAPSILDIAGAAPLPDIHGRSWKKLAKGDDDPDWRSSYVYMYNYEKQFPYTPNVRAVRTERWKFVRYPHGDGAPDRHKAELYDLKNDPDEVHNLIDDPRYAQVVQQMRGELERALAAVGAAPDRMPIDQGIGTELPDPSIR